jgi:hypothetical protein
MLLFAETYVPGDLIFHLSGVLAGIMMGIGVYIAAYQDRLTGKSDVALAADTA